MPHEGLDAENVSFCFSILASTSSVSKYNSFQDFQYKLHTDVYRHVLKYRFTHFVPYVVSC